MSDDLDDETQEDLDSTPASDSASSPAPTSPGAGVVSPASFGAAQSPMNPTLTAYLQNISKGKSELSEAQDKANTNQLISTLARAGGQVSHGFSGDSGSMDTSAYDALDKAAQAPVQQVLQRQNAEGGQVSNIANEVKMASMIQANDPTSAQSRAVQGQIARLYPGKYSPIQLASVPASMAPVILKPLELDEKIQQASRDRSDKANATTDAKQGQAYTSMRKDLESFRGNQSVQQAAIGVQNADKALALVGSTPTSQNLALLADEMGKVAMNGVPSESGQKALMPDNLYTKAAQWKAWATGHPNASAADVTEYLQNDRDYLNQVRKISTDAVKSYRTNIAKGYKARVSPDQYQEVVDDYGLGGNNSPQVQQQQPQKRQVSSDEILQYSKKHGMTPDAAKSWLGSQGYGVN